MKFATIVFRCAAMWGVFLLTLLYFAEPALTPPLTHPDFYYGFLGTALSFQVVFWLIASNPVKYRPMMLAASLPKFAYAITLSVLYLQQRLSSDMLLYGGIDFFLGLLFVFSFYVTRSFSDDAG